MEFRTFAIASAVAATLTFAQSNYMTGTQIKCKSGKTAECEAFLNTTFRKAMQLRVERGMIQSYALYRLVDPIPAEAGFTHSFVITSDKPLSAEASDEYRKAEAEATGMPSEAFRAKANELRDVVSRTRSKFWARAGMPAEKGDFTRVQYLKTPRGKRLELRELAQIRAAMMEQLVKSGRLRGYNYREVMLRGEADSYDAVEAITYKDGQTAMDDPPPFAQLKAAFDAGNPGKDYQQFVNKRVELVHTQMVRTLKLMDVIRK
jgi:hypothetical protein